jgi:hypothetical protein
VQGCFVGNIYCVGSGSVLLAHLKFSKRGDFGCFLLKFADFSMFSIKPGGSGRVLSVVTMGVGAGDSVGG